MSTARDEAPKEAHARKKKINTKKQETTFTAGSNNPMAKKQNERVLRKKFEKKKPRLSTLRALMIAFLFGILCAGQYGAIQDMGLSINEKQAALKEINAENEALKQKSAQLSNKSVIKEEASKQLGMSEAEDIIVYTPSEK